MSLIIFGPPGSGKGSQCQLLSETFHYRHISSGDLLRHEKEQNSHRGELIRSAIASGDLVPDEIVIGMVQEKVFESPYEYILDGIPRTVQQAEILTELKIIPEYLFILEIEENLLIDRLEARRICPDCPDAVYNLLSHPPKSDGYCDHCGQELIKRADDCEATIRHRLDLYHQETEPVLRYYGRLLHSYALLRIPVRSTIESTFAAICSILKSKQI